MASALLDLGGTVSSCQVPFRLLPIQTINSAYMIRLIPSLKLLLHLRIRVRTIPVMILASRTCVMSFRITQFEYSICKPFLPGCKFVLSILAHDRAERLQKFRKPHKRCDDVVSSLTVTMRLSSNTVVVESPRSLIANKFNNFFSKIVFPPCT